MIAEVIGAAFTVGWALLAWIVLTAVVATAALYAVVVAVWAVVRFIWLTLSAAWAAAASFRTHSRRCGASQGDGGGFSSGRPGTGRRTALRAASSHRALMGPHRHRGSRMTHTDPEPPPDEDDNGPWCNTPRSSAP